MTFCFCTELDGVVIPDSVSGIGESAFASCTNLKNLTIANGVWKLVEWCIFEKENRIVHYAVKHEYTEAF